MMKVFIPHLPTRYDRATDRRVPSFDVNPAAEWGDIVTLLDENLPLTAETLGDACREVRLKLCKGMVSGDCIMCIGDVALVASAAAWAIEAFGFVNLLRWDREEKKYELVEV